MHNSPTAPNVPEPVAHHTELINLLIERFGFRSYLEIGCAANRNFERICLSDKVGVDPHRGGTLRMDSDQFFRVNRKLFDLIFIDGLHWREQVLRDVEHALGCVNESALILIHDCLPEHEEQQLRKVSRGAWTGDVWKAVVELRQRDDLDIAVLNGCWGMGVIRMRRNSAPLNRLPKLSWKRFVAHKRELLHVLDWEEYWQFLLD